MSWTGDKEERLKKSVAILNEMSLDLADAIDALNVAADLLKADRILEYELSANLSTAEMVVGSTLRKFKDVAWIHFERIPADRKKKKRKTR